MTLINDPTPIGWAIFLGYFAVAALCVAASRSGCAPTERLGGRLERLGAWRMAGGLAAALGANKQLDLQTHLIALGKRIVLDMGWYADRLLVQTLFSIGVLFALLCLAAAAFVMLRRHAAVGGLLAAAGIALICTYAGCRAAYFVHIDETLGGSLASVPQMWMVEAGGLLMMGLGAMRSLIGRGEGRRVAASQIAAN